jgi:hypothetical protein
VKVGKHRRATTKESDEVSVARGCGLHKVRAENGGAKRDGLPKNMREYSIVSSSYHYYFSVALVVFE